MSKFAANKAKRAQRPAAEIVRNRREAAAAMHRIASASVNDHADAMERALTATHEAAWETGVEDPDLRPFAVVVAAIDPSDPAKARAVLEAAEEAARRAKLVERLTGDRIIL